MKSTINTIVQGAIFLGLSAVNAMAVNIGAGGAMPWEKPMGGFAGSITGPTAIYATEIGVGLAGAGMLWHGDLGEFGQRVAKVAVAGGTCCFAGSIMNAGFGVAAACV